MEKIFDEIQIIDAHENNLKNISVNIPKNKLVIFAGVSGSGKSSLAFDTIAVESNRQWQENYPLFLRNKMPHYDRPKIGEIKNLTPAVVINQKNFGTSSRSTVGTAIDIAPLIRLLFSRVGNPSAGGSMSYSFNHPLGMCPNCTGFGEKLELIEENFFDEEKSLSEGAILFSQFSSGWQTYLYQNNPLLDANKKLKNFSADEWKILKFGAEKNIKIEIRSNNTGRVDKVDYEGVIPRFNRLYLNRDISKLKKNLQEEILSHVCKKTCKICGGSGLNPAALASKIDGLNIVDYFNLPVSDLLKILQKIKNPIGISIAKQIENIFEKMIEVGIGYLNLGRKTETLSGGELQRIKIVRNLGSSLTNITYIFDEPTSGLHPADAEKIAKILLDLRDKKNNVLVVEHNRQMIEIADHIIELGKFSGINGGNIIFEGNLKNLLKAETFTAKILNEKIKINENPKKINDFFEIKNASVHNLKNFDVKIPKKILVAITGVAGSGKSSLARYEFVKNYPEAIVIDQKPIGTSIRSNSATYIGIMDEIRNIFAKENKVKASLFSFNSDGGCKVCKGTGQIVYDMAFAEPVTVICEECGGKRYDKKILNYKYKGKNIEEVLNLTVEQAKNFFDSEKIKNILEKMIEVGLEYLTLGQPTSTLSGGELQRIKIIGELNKSGKIYIFDEPSNGLSGKDIEKILKLLRNLVEKNNSVIIVEHRLELIAKADWIIDLGPGGGSDGGKIIFEGTPKDLIKCDDSKTAQFLKKFL